MLSIQAFVSLALLGCLSCALAQSPPVECPKTPFWFVLPEGAERQRAELESLAVFTEVCDARDDFHVQRGTLFLQLKRFQEAAVALEKALLINPELAGAQLDYAQALAALGRRKEAIDLLEQVIRRPDIEQSLRDWLRREIELVALAERSQPIQADPLGLIQRGLGQQSDAQSPGPVLSSDKPIRLSGVLQTGIGHESNLTGASNARELTLYLVNGPVLVPLSDAQAPSGGVAQRSLLAVQAASKAGLAEVQVGALLQSRRSINEPIPLQQFSRVELQTAYPFGSHRTYVGISQQNLEQGALYAAKDQKFTLGYVVAPRQGICHRKLELSRSELRYPLNPVMDGVFRAVRGEANCQLFGELKLGASLGLDDPKQVGRPGGDRKSYELYARHLVRFNAPMLKIPLKATSWLRTAQTTDSDLFSDLLAQRPTATQRIDAGLGIAWPLGTHWEINTEFETNAQRSNNPLINLNNRSLYFVLRWQFD